MTQQLVESSAPEIGLEIGFANFKNDQHLLSRDNSHIIEPDGFGSSRYLDLFAKPNYAHLV